MTTIPEHNDTIVAPATADGGAMCVIRISGDSAIEICDTMFRGRRQLAEAKTHTLHYGEIVDRSGCAVDDVVAAVFRAPHSYTGDDTVEISAHGSHYIVSRIIRLAISAGARMARAGEFTSRAFLAGRLDLSQAEAVADIIASDSQWSHAVAATQMRGGYSDMLRQLRDKLLRLTSLLELELDFSEEDVEFADRSELRDILVDVQHHTRNLTGSFALGNALKEGVGVAIVGRPNAGKSTLLNRLAGDDRAMVSDIAGTTRDTIEATANIDGVVFRFIDTAGLRITDDRLEQMGMERTRDAISKARIILHLTTPDDPSEEPVSVAPSQQYIRLINKI
ncbi:MAG: tRNA uridine-5-carboxymethylaminomethyl(34) synthesis GTPase MnmE, partial [Alistipes sp.]|nr:tRNA uridine-5-carboxymethylaminomethyl(34) synthesis GTPase MnmE [Alistipes sp.]